MAAAAFIGRVAHAIADIAGGGFVALRERDVAAIGGAAVPAEAFLLQAPGGAVAALGVRGKGGGGENEKRSGEKRFHGFPLYAVFR